MKLWRGWPDVMGGCGRWRQASWAACLPDWPGEFAWAGVRRALSLAVPTGLAPGVFMSLQYLYVVSQQ